jgi:2,3-bisphosphoglycerate-dependent phosphoglycerate mutase
MNYLVLVRHGESRWNIANKFTGWVDVPLSERGVQEAVTAAKSLDDLNLEVAFSSKLERAQATLLIILSSQDQTGIFIHEEEKGNKWQINSNKLGNNDIPVYSNSALNERYYGELQGVDKNKARKKYGEKKVFGWRRGYSNTPPMGESLKDVYHRVVPYFKTRVMKEIKAKKNVIVSAHGNSLRAMIKHIDDISDEDIPHLELPTGTPIIYEYSRGKLRRKDDGFTFDRPIYWTGPKNGNKNNQKKK